MLLKCISYIHHWVQFIKNQAEIQDLLDFDSNVNIITLAYTTKLDPKI